ncbi:MAG TPA: hypothetical protein VNO54_00640 [Streptosporangiaceae bacterium]|nr:hypothetical protein [Streptosporangiaceae bacterium]
MIAEAIDTAYTIGWAIVAWITLTAAFATLALYTVVVAVAFACEALWRGVTAAVAAVQRLGAPALPPEPQKPPQARAAPSWAREAHDHQEAA